MIPYSGTLAKTLKAFPSSRKYNGITVRGTLKPVKQIDDRKFWNTGPWPWGFELREQYYPYYKKRIRTVNQDYIRLVVDDGSRTIALPTQPGWYSGIVINPPEDHSGLLYRFDGHMWTYAGEQDGGFDGSAPS